MSMQTFRGDFAHPGAVQEAARLMSSGHAVAVDNDMVFAVWGDGSNPDFAAHVGRIKEGRDLNKPFGLTIPSESFLPFVDTDRIHPEVRGLVEDPERFAQLFGALVFVRVPVKARTLEDLEVPPSVISYTADGLPILQNWTPEGKPNVEDLLDRTGITFVAVTSFSNSGEKEATNLAEADALQQSKIEKGIDVPLLTDQGAIRKLQGSYPIISLDDQPGITGLRARAESIDGWAIEMLLHGYKVKWADGGRQPQADGAVSRLAVPELITLKGAEFADGVRHYLGWTVLLNA